MLENIFKKQSRPKEMRFVMVYKTLREKDMMLRGAIILAAVLLLSSGCVLVAPPPQAPVEPPVIEPQNNPPIIKTMITKSKISISSTSEISCEAEDPDGNALTYSWSASGGTIEGQDPVVNWIAPETPGEYTIAVVVDDNQGGTAMNSVTITVTDEPNQPPIITSLIITTAKLAGPITIDPSVEQLYRPLISVGAFKSAVIVCVAEDPDADDLTYTWTATDGNITDEEGRKAVWIAPNNPVRHFVTVEVNDACGGSSTAKVAFDVTCCDK